MRLYRKGHAIIYLYITYLPAQVRPGAPEPVRAARFRLEGACCRTEPAPLTTEH